MKYITVDQGIVSYLHRPLWASIGGTGSFKTYSDYGVSEIMKLSKSSKPDDLTRVTRLKNVLYQILALTFAESIFPIIYEMVENARTNTNIPLRLNMNMFKTYLPTYLNESNAPLSNATIRDLYSLFIHQFGDVAAKNVLAKSEQEKKDSAKVDQKIYPAPLSKKYQIIDVSNIIYNNVNPQRLKKLMTECKQMLLIEYNETRMKKSKKDNNVIPHEVKVVSFDPATRTIEFFVNELKDPTFKTTSFYITKNNKNFYMVTPTETVGNKIVGTIYSDDKEIGIVTGDKVSAAETFGARYDIQAQPAEKRQSTFWKKLKKTSDVIGITGDASIFKTASGELVSAMGGHINQIRQAWGIKFPWEKELNPKEIKGGTDAHIRYCIFRMFADYIDWKINKVDFKTKVRNMTNIIPILADNIAEYDKFVAWILETTNYVLGEYIQDFPEQQRTRTLLSAYIKKRTMFRGMSSKSISNAIDNVKNAVQASVDVGNLSGLGRVGNQKSDPKAAEIIGVNKQEIVNDFLDYCVSLKIVENV